MDILPNLNLLRTLEARFLDLFSQEFTAAVNFSWSKSSLSNDVTFSKIPHGLKL